MRTGLAILCQGHCQLDKVAINDVSCVYVCMYVFYSQNTFTLVSDNDVS